MIGGAALRSGADGPSPHALSAAMTGSARRRLGVDDVPEPVRGDGLHRQGGIDVASHAASEHGVVGSTRAMSNEWAAHRRKLDAAAPGHVETDNAEPLRAGANRKAAITDRIPAARWGTPTDISGPSPSPAPGPPATCTAASTVHRILRDLVRSGCAEEDEDHGYPLRSRVLALAARAGTSSFLARKAAR